MDEYSAYHSAEQAELYDAVYAAVDDIAFWEQTAAAADGPLLELACGTGRLLIPLARAGHEVTGVDLSAHMIALCRAKLQLEPEAVRERVSVLEADMTSFELDRRFAHAYCTFGSFHHLVDVEQQLACLAACHRHLLPGGMLVLDLINPDPAPATSEVEGATAHSADAEPAIPTASGAGPVAPATEDLQGGTVDWTAGRRIRSWATVLGSNRLQQTNDCEVTYEITENDGTTRHVTESFPMRFLFRYELEHLLARSDFLLTALYGDYDRSHFADDSLGMIAVAQAID